MVEYLDEDDEFGDNNLTLRDHIALKPYPGISADLRKVNYRILISSIVACVALVVNVIVSGLFLFNPPKNADGTTSPVGFRTATTYITNVIIIAQILKTTISNAYAGIQHHLALSCVHFEPVSYNVIDRDHVDCCRNMNHVCSTTDCAKVRTSKGLKPIEGPQAPIPGPIPRDSKNAATLLTGQSATATGAAHLTGPPAGLVPPPHTPASASLAGTDSAASVSMSPLIGPTSTVDVKLDLPAR